MLLLTSCDKEISKEEAQVKAASIQTAQETTTYKSMKGTIEYSLVLAASSSRTAKLEYGVDLENKFVYYEYEWNKVVGENTKTDKKKVYSFIDSTEGFVRAGEVNGEKVYTKISADTTKYDAIVEDQIEMMNYVIEEAQDIAVDTKDILEDIANNDDLEGSMNSVFSGFGVGVAISSSYTVKYFTSSSSTFGVAMNVTNSASWTSGSVSVGGDARVEWKNNLLSKVSTNAKLTYGENEYKSSYSQSIKYNSKVVKNINLKNYTYVDKF